MYNTNNMNIVGLWSLITIYGIATDEELNLVTDVAGYSIETLNAVIYSRTGYRDINQYAEETAC